MCVSRPLSADSMQAGKPAPASKPVGALLISDAVKAGGTDDGAYDHVTLLRTLEDFFALDPLGEAKDAKAMEVTNSSR